MISSSIRRPLLGSTAGALRASLPRSVVGSLQNSPHFSSKAAKPPPPKKQAPPPKPAAAAAAPATPPKPTTATSIAGKLGAVCADLPHMDAVRYEHKNRTWTYQHVHYYSEALAVGIAESGFRPGDVVLSCLPSHFSEQMVLQFACAKAGFVLYTLDPSLATKDAGAAKKALASALALSKANVLVSQEADNDANYVSLAHSVVPELRIYDASSGLPFVTPRFPSLRMCIHTGFDQDDNKYGWIPLRQMVVPSDNLSDFVPSGALSGSTPLGGTFQLDAQGIPTGIGPTLTNDQVESTGAWPAVSSILNKDLRTVKGVGVVF